MIVYLGITEGRVKGGMAVLILENLRAFAKEWRCMNERLMKIRLKLVSNRGAGVCSIMLSQKTV